MLALWAKYKAIAFEVEYGSVSPQFGSNGDTVTMMTIPPTPERVCQEDERQTTGGSTGRLIPGVVAESKGVAGCE